MNRCLAILLFAMCFALACADEVPVLTTDAGPECDVGALDCACEVRGNDRACEGGAICDATTQLCRRALACEELPCVQHQRCAPPADGLDAECLSSCEPGFAWEEDSGRCVAAEATCEADDPVSIAVECEKASRECVVVDARHAACGGCLTGYALVSGQCRELERCEKLSCADQNRTCAEATEERDARCTECVEGTVEDSNGTCIRQSCTEDADGASVGATCAAANRVCVATDVGAGCGACYAGHVEVDSVCQKGRDCEELGCSKADRLCATNEGQDATCTSCRAGYVEVAGVCVVDTNATCEAAPAAGSVMAACAAERRTCTNNTCGDCLSGYYWDAARGECAESVRCETCSESHLECVSENGATRCGECEDGYIVDRASGNCRPVTRCADVDCAQGDICVEATAHNDALCRTDCGERAIFNGSVCAPCPSCAAKDTHGNPIELGFEPRATRDGQCICRTAPNYFYSLAGEIGTFPCDADGDGWVRQSARVAYDIGDPILLDNARCTLQHIERFALVNERGDRHDVQLDTPLPMFESDRNDDDLLLGVTWDRLDLPTDFDPSYVNVNGAACSRDRDCAAAEVCRQNHCTSVPSLSAAALNPLTKYCHSVLTDYNDNGVADVEEWAERPTVRGEERRALNRFAYFAELHTGRWEPSQVGGSTGVFVITERTRAAEQGAAYAALTYDDTSPDAHWRSCTVRRDVEWDQFERPIGMDFASFEPNPDAYLVDVANPMWRGMTHHSQFKCLTITSEPDAESPNEVSVADANLPSRDLNVCRLVDIEPAADVNPAHPVFECNIRSNPPSAGAVLWASVNYGDYRSAATLDGYVRGCVNGCAEARLRADARLSDVGGWDCPTADRGAENDGDDLACTRDLMDHGKLVCLEACGDGIDNDGDGLVDDDDLFFTDPVSGLELTVGQPCNTSLPGVCSTGVVGCEARPGGAFTCLHLEPSELDLCDGLDNDCDGVVDEDAADPPSGSVPATPSGTPHVGEACQDTRQFGICREGMLLCRDLEGGGRGLMCESIRTTGVAELCNTLDDDCDGLVDEVADLPAPFGTSCTPLDDAGNSRLGVCASGEIRCVDGAQQCAQLQTATSEARDENFATCDTLDNDCDGQVDEGDACVGVGSYDGILLSPQTPTVGDREFQSHGPMVTVTVRHSVVQNGLRVESCADFVETVADFSTARACATRVFSVPGRSISMPLSEDAKLVYVDTGFDLDVLLPLQSNTETMVELTAGDLTSASCVGDTDGDDIGLGTHCTVSGSVRYRVQPVAP